MLYAEDFRRIARKSLEGRWALAVGTGLVAALFGGTGSSFNYSNSNWKERINHDSFEVLLPFLPIIIGVLTFFAIYAIVTFFIGGAITLGYCRFNKNLIENTNPQFSDLFSKFNVFWDAFLMRLLMAIYTFLWTLLFIIPGIIAAFSYAMTPYILEEHPEMSVNEAITASKEMMRGNKGRLFCLDISFIGWYILSLFTLGIGLLWLVPYQSAATAAFYYEVSGKFANANGTMDGQNYYSTQM